MAAKANQEANEKAKKNGALRVPVVGVGNMGASHARAYGKIDGFELAGLCARRIAKRTDLPGGYSELELSVLRQRSQEALRVKAARGDLLRTVAVGYVRPP
jgi:predicted homoserine dehydrogenase-like protein